MKQPQRISDRTVDLRNHVFPWQDGQPVLARMEGNSDLFILLFSSTEILSETLTAMDIAFDAIKQVDDPVEFLNSLPYIYAGKRLRVIVNPQMTARETMRYIEVIRETIN